MSRFKGWTLKAVQGYNAPVEKKESVKIVRKKVYTDYEKIISDTLTEAGYENVREYKFIKDRRFRFDIAMPELKIAIEYEGGVYTYGGHTRPKGFIRDCKKQNLANMHGWTLLRYNIDTMHQLDWKDQIINDIKKTLQERENNETQRSKKN